MDTAVPFLLSALAITLGWYLNEITRSRNEKKERAQRREDFERETLLGLQNAVSVLAQATIRLYLIGWEGADPDETSMWNNKQRDAFQDSAVLVTRVADERLAREVRAFRTAAGKLNNATDAGTAKAAALELNDALSLLNDNLGLHLLQLL